MTTWWHWLVAGLILIALEMAASGGFYVIFFGIAALAISLLHLLDIAGPLWFQLLLFSALSVLSLLVFRNPLMKLLHLDQGAADVDTLVGETGVAIDVIQTGDLGRVELRGSGWNARNVGDMTLTPGHRCIVTRTEGLTLFVRAEEAVA
jgi:membrane protein implicated in regulation of membrane protease activity